MDAAAFRCDNFGCRLYQDLIPVDPDIRFIGDVLCSWCGEPVTRVELIVIEPFMGEAE